MRGAKVETQSMFSYLSPEQRVPQDHPLRTIRVIVDRSLAELDGHFDQVYSDLGRPSIPPEHLLCVLLLQVLYSIHSERQMMEQMDYNLLYRNNQSMTIIHEEVTTQAGQTRSFSGTFDVEPGAWVGHGSMGVVATLLPPKIGVASSAILWVLGLKGFLGGPGLQKCPIHREMFFRQETLPPCLVQHGPEKLPYGPKIQQPAPILGKNRGYSDRSIYSQPGADRYCLGGATTARALAGSTGQKHHSPCGRTTHQAGYTISIHVRWRIESIFGWMKTVGWDAENQIPWLGADRPAFLAGRRRFHSGPHSAIGGGLMAVMRPELKKWSEKTAKMVKTVATGMLFTIFDKNALLYKLSQIFFHPSKRRIAAIIRCSFLEKTSGQGLQMLSKINGRYSKG